MLRASLPFSIADPRRPHSNNAIGPREGSPLRSETEAHGRDGLRAATDAAADAIAARFGTGDIQAPMRAHVVTASG